MDSDQHGHTGAGFVDKCVVAEVEEQDYGPAYLTTTKFMRSIKMQAGNRSIQVFLVERSVLAYLHRSLVLGNLLQVPIPGHSVKAVSFDGIYPRPDQLTNDEVTLYTPDAFNNEAVDCVVRIINCPPRAQTTPARQQPHRGKRLRPDEGESVEEEEEEEEREQGKSERAEAKTQVTVIGVQVTLAKLTQDKKLRTARCLDHRLDWTHDFNAPKVDSYKLVYVVEKGRRAASFSHLHGDLTVPAFQVELDVVNSMLAEAVAFCIDIELARRTTARKSNVALQPSS